MVKKAIVTGGSSGLGLQISKELAANGVEVANWDLTTGIDLTDEQHIKDAAEWEADNGKIDWLINCAGINKIDWFEELTSDDWDNVVGLNAKAIFLTSKYLLPIMKQGGAICNIVSNASHMPMTNSAVYNASKGAAHILTLQMARELKKTHSIDVFGVSPNKLAGTQMSAYIDDKVCELRGWTKDEAQAYQVAGLPSGKETDPAACGEFVAMLLLKDQFRTHINGTILPFGA